MRTPLWVAPFARWQAWDKEGVWVQGRQGGPEGRRRWPGGGRSPLETKIRGGGPLQHLPTKRLFALKETDASRRGKRSLNRRHPARGRRGPAGKWGDGEGRKRGVQRPPLRPLRCGRAECFWPEGGDPRAGAWPPQSRRGVVIGGLGARRRERGARLLRGAHRAPWVGAGSGRDLAPGEAAACQK